MKQRTVNPQRLPHYLRQHWLLSVFLKKYLFSFFFFFFAVLGLSCSIWDLVPHPGIEPQPPTLGAHSLIPWTTRQIVSLSMFLNVMC